MAAPWVGLRDVTQRRGSRLRLLAPLRYLSIHHPEKATYDIIVPLGMTAIGCLVYFAVQPHPAIFGEAGILKFTRDLLIMAVPFMVGALAAVAMGSPGTHIDKRPAGADLLLDGEVLTLRQFVCYLLGYLSFVSLVVLLLSITATVLHDPTMLWLSKHPALLEPVRVGGVVVLCFLLSSLTVTVLWSLYFLTDIVNRKL
ncbi:hypothetical protein QA635_33895 [Bradyrhizobium brasilense]|uniref:hypothetical protein n=1 Tax=Bradyrhizobium brasilense TaxID=1419277 RepID=UPI0024B18B10|nr:hypothetical protein [Bradyrhizobium australafricanum]WFU31476.1 hypothetical protein QA635_33895 [Bradyrhizobium australafricanum]